MAVVLKEDIDSIKHDWLTDNVCHPPLKRTPNANPQTRPSHSGKSKTKYSKNPSHISRHTDTIRHRYLEREELTHFPKAQIVLLRPSMSFMLMQTKDPLTLREALPNFSKTTHIFLPINDNNDVSRAEGGSHWSLLLVSIIDGVAFHYDSLAPSNDAEARSTCMKLEQLLQRGLKFIHMQDSPQQENGSDCGVFVCLIMKHLLLKRLLRADASRKITMSMRDQYVNAHEGRKSIMRVIEEKRKEGEKRRSYVVLDISLLVLPPLSSSKHADISFQLSRRSVSPFRPGSSKSKSPPRIGEENESLKSLGSPRGT